LRDAVEAVEVLSARHRVQRRKGAD